MSTAEMLLALRSPNAGWLAAVLCALDEAMQDPSFDTSQRAIVRELLDRDALPDSVAIAAQMTLCEFETAVQAGRTAHLDSRSAVATSQRTKLTLCVSNG